LLNCSGISISQQLYCSLIDEGLGFSSQPVNACLSIIGSNLRSALTSWDMTLFKLSSSARRAARALYLILTPPFGPVSMTSGLNLGGSLRPFSAA